MTIEEIGVALSILTAVSWSLAAVLYKVGLKEEDSDVIVANGIRAFPALLFIFLATIFLGNMNEINKLTTWLLFLIVVNVSVGILLGDCLFFIALRDAGVAIGYPVSYTYSLFVSIFAYFFLQEPVNIWTFVSAIFVIFGIFLLFFKAEKSESKHMVKGLVAAILTAMCWGISIPILKILLLNIEPFFLNLVRLIVLNLIVWLLILSKKDKRRKVRSLGRSGLIALLTGGIFGIGLGAILFLFSINLIGAAKSTIITSSSPLFSTVLGVAVLKEKLDKLRILGIAIIILGIYTLTIT
ncbi:MAG: DMT family transporter [Candidatus Baldrarchaeia archaeon]